MHIKEQNRNIQAKADVIKVCDARLGAGCAACRDRSGNGVATHTRRTYCDVRCIAATRQICDHDAAGKHDIFFGASCTGYGNPVVIDADV